MRAVQQKLHEKTDAQASHEVIFCILIPKFIPNFLQNTYGRTTLQLHRMLKKIHAEAKRQDPHENSHRWKTFQVWDMLRKFLI